MSKAGDTIAQRPITFSERTLMPIGFVGVLLGGAMWVGELSTRVTSTENDVDRMRTRLVLRLDDEDKKLNNVSIQLSGIDAKLSSFIDFYKGSKSTSK